MGPSSGGLLDRSISGVSTDERGFGLGSENLEDREVALALEASLAYSRNNVDDRASADTRYFGVQGRILGGGSGLEPP